MKKYYIKPSINVVVVKTTIMAGSDFSINNTAGDPVNALGRRKAIQWMEEEEE